MSWKEKARQLKSEMYVLYLACRHPKTPWYAKLLAVVIIGYAFSPIDLIPDFIPVLGYLDDMILLPLGIALLIKLIPAEIMTECRARAEEIRRQKPVNRFAAVVIILIWLGLAFLAGYWVWRMFH
jgi:uncharacterized membrane protein YkvA (DUF1232 family)